MSNNIEVTFDSNMPDIEADFVMQVANDDHSILRNRDLPEQHPMGAITGLESALGSKVDKTTEANKVYGTDENGDQTTYNADNFGKVDDVQVGGVSVVTDKIAELGTMALESASDYTTTAIADTLYASISYEGKVDTLENTIGGYGNIVTHDVDEFATAAQGELAATAVQPDALTPITNDISTINGKIPNAASASNQLTDKNYVDGADNNLQQQIDAITAASDVTDIVGTYADLQNYDTTDLPNNSIIKVLKDESRDDETTYYRWVITGGTGSWVLIGEEGPYYTKAEANVLLQAKQDTITGAATSITSNNLTASRALTSDSNGKVAVSSVTSTELGYVSGVTSAIQTQINNKANTSLSNLSADGQMTVDSLNGTISNCILEIPQNLKMEVVPEGIVLKAGSVVCIPDNTFIYKTITTTDDITFTGSGDRSLYLRSNGITPIYTAIDSEYSGNTSPAQTYSTWYDTTNNTVYRYSNDASTPDYTLSFPLCRCHLSSTAGGSYFLKDSNGNDMIFNGACFVGHHAVVYPNVSALTPNGFNDDGSLKSNKIKTYAVGIYEIGTTALSLGGTVNTASYYVESEDEPSSNYALWYKPSVNIMYRKSGSGTVAVNGGTLFVTAAYNGSVVTKFDIRQPVRTATVEMLDTLQSVKLDKITTTTTYTQVYAKNTNGAATMLDVTQSATNNAVARRTSGGTIRTATPTDNADAATKLYVDTIVGDIETLLNNINSGS